MKCQMILLVAALCVFFVESDAKPSQVCSPGATFKMQCNQCKCSGDGTNMVCTKLICFDNEGKAIEEKQQESTGEKTEEKAEKAEDAGGAETKTSVDTQEPTAAEPETKKTEEDERADSCVPGSTYKKDCNQCTCPPSGLKSSGACTLLSCESLPTPTPNNS